MLDDVGKADRLRDLTDLVVDLRMRRAGEDIDRALRGEAVGCNAKAGDDRGHQRKSTRRKQRTSWRLIGRKRGKIGGTVGHLKSLRSLKRRVPGQAPLWI